VVAEATSTTADQISAVCKRLERIDGGAAGRYVPGLYHGIPPGAGQLEGPC
jgi:hypothetical protein